MTPAERKTIQRSTREQLLIKALGLVGMGGGLYGFKTVGERALDAPEVLESQAALRQHALEFRGAIQVAQEARVGGDKNAPKTIFDLERKRQQVETDDRLNIVGDVYNAAQNEAFPWKGPLSLAAFAAGGFMFGFARTPRIAPETAKPKEEIDDHALEHQRIKEHLESSGSQRSSPPHTLRRKLRERRKEDPEVLPKPVDMPQQQRSLIERFFRGLRSIKD